nr:inosine/xanthosine triphosphatase [Anaerolineae bacterium]
MIVAVGSTNCVKIQATQAVFEQVAPDATIIPVEVSSGVSPQPWGDEETRAGACNRARAALLSVGGVYGVGFEGGVIKTELGVMTCAWCAVINPAGTLGIGGGVHTLLPPAAQERLLGGEELGDIMDELTGVTDSKRGIGAVGILTDKLTNRESAYAQILALALAPFRRPDLYGNIP